MEWLLAHLAEIMLSVITACALGFAKSVHKKYKALKALDKEKTQDEIVALVQEEVKPIIAEIHSLQNQINALETREHEEISAIVHSYKFRLIQLCMKYIKQNYITPGQLEQVSEFYKVYIALGGNGQAQMYYSKVLGLPVQNHKYDKKEEES